MDSMTIIAVASIVTAGITTGFGTMGPAFAEGRAVATALTSLAQQRKSKRFARGVICFRNRARQAAHAQDEALPLGNRDRMTGVQ